ncbi:hypothetical protein BATDEDRAFT_33065 [Batrachochytrium dendrobatidis JAM81]|uniref:Uncharacterized protein n=2 Tax=Batrachochytrium dendrobatidis TaxID=109871 RepID=F4NZU4_BATDJ|nr:uncharacterized protein BATDEDRAFT_33065 [Batrachochytrium dendrobatidis JAM81]EGF81148.1 hypothetical protein BATDEDRAFT_33065 [Batrachochytrium dendrobatidis JAM81]OAJ38417.1 hypothetical protein BDEG_22353 [Batrachochytrium dendrobatidis JEL423]OAJ38425.1 hypothetical protein BDEG_22360 [Batrachochytrium dendrobatidis JEL423]|eukprot:XP_006677973.1 hypothetical protein BATDEDRAFT_33065 [Batrachochytrium dendrobatidis JAM81]
MTVDSASMLTGLAANFPGATKLVFTASHSAHDKFQTLSPESKVKLVDAASASADVAWKSYQWLRNVYVAVLSWGTKPLDRWHQPSGFILHLLASLILFILPVDDLWITTDIPKGKVVYAGNQNIYGIDTLSTLSIIFKKTGVLPRVIVQPMHFKIPIWKHFIEYMGAVSCEHPEAIDYLMSLEYPLFVYPGGAREFFRKKNEEKYSLEWRHIELYTRIIDDLNTFAPKYQYLVVPVASIGVNDMLKIVWECPWNVYNLMKKVSIVRPVSYERQYVTVQMPILLHQGKYDDVYVQETLEKGIQDTIVRRDKAGKKRYMLRKVSKTLGYIFHKDGIVMRSWWFVFDVVQFRVMHLLVYILYKLQDSEEMRDRDDYDTDSDVLSSGKTMSESEPVVSDVPLTDESPKQMHPMHHAKDRFLKLFGLNQQQK